MIGVCLVTCHWCGESVPVDLLHYCKNNPLMRSMIDAAIPKDPKPITEDDIRRIVREEIAKSQEPQWKSA